MIWRTTFTRATGLENLELLARAVDDVQTVADRSESQGGAAPVDYCTAGHVTGIVGAARAQGRLGQHLVQALVGHRVRQFNVIGVGQAGRVDVRRDVHQSARDALWRQRRLLMVRRRTGLLRRGCPVGAESCAVAFLKEIERLARGSSIVASFGIRDDSAARNVEEPLLGLGPAGERQAPERPLDQVVAKTRLAKRPRQGAAPRPLLGESQERSEGVVVAPRGHAAKDLWDDEQRALVFGSRERCGRPREMGAQRFPRATVSEVSQERDDIVAAGERRIREQRQQVRNVRGTHLALGDLLGDAVDVQPTCSVANALRNSGVDRWQFARRGDAPGEIALCARRQENEYEWGPKFHLGLSSASAITPRPNGI